jgi:hypothetical protein
LFELLGQNVAVVGVASERSRPDNEPLFVRDSQAHLDAELVRLTVLARSGLGCSDIFPCLLSGTSGAVMLPI